MIRPSRTAGLLAYLPPERSTSTRTCGRGDIATRYEKVRSQDTERGYHHPAHAWALSAPTPGFPPPIASLADARGIFHQAFAGLGKEYQAAYDELLDPSK